MQIIVLALKSRILIVVNPEAECLCRYDGIINQRMAKRGLDKGIA